MYTISKDFTFAAAHAVRGHQGGCQNLHGHNYRVRIHLRSEELDELGMVLDYADLKAMAAEILDPFDHSVLNDHPPFDRINPTAELIAEHVYERMEERLAGEEATAGRVGVVRIEVWENDRNRAQFDR